MKTKQIGYLKRHLIYKVFRYLIIKDLKYWLSIIIVIFISLYYSSTFLKIEAGFKVGKNTNNKFI